MIAGRGAAAGRHPRSAGRANQAAATSALACPRRNIAVFPQPANGGFKARLNYAAPATDPGTPTALAGGDFNRDGNLDLVVGMSRGNGTNGIGVLLGIGDGTFVKGSALDNAPNIADGTTSLSSADFDLDGRLDLLMLDSGTGRTATLWRGLDNGMFQIASRVNLGGQPSVASIGDFDRDGRSDAWITVQPGTMAVLINATR